VSCHSSLFVSGADLALEAGVSIRTVQCWAKAGHFHKQGFNSYDLLGYYRWQNQSLKQEISALKGSALDWDARWREGRARKSLAEGKLVELELQKLSQSVVLREVVVFELEKILSCCIASVRTFPRLVNAELSQAKSADPINHILNTAVTAVLSQIQVGLKKLQLPPDLAEKCESFYASYSSSLENGSEPT
jgi:phage terminase Nu1 subunit (DNA packaging protein)